MPFERLAFIEEGVAFRRLVSPPLGGQAEGGGARLPLDNLGGDALTGLARILRSAVASYE